MKNRIRRLGLSAKLILCQAVAAIVLVTGIWVVQQHAGEAAIQRDLTQSAAVVSQRLEVSLSRSVYEFNRPAIRDAIRAEFPDEDIHAIAVYSCRTGQDPVLLCASGRQDGRITDLAAEPPTGAYVIQRQTLVHLTPDHPPEQIGEVAVFFDSAMARQRLTWSQLNVMGQLVLVIALLVLVLGYVTDRFVVGPLERIRHAMATVTDTAQSETSGLEAVGADLAKSRSVFSELRTMGLSFDVMVAALRKQFRELMALNASLESKNAKLETTEAELREREQRIRSIADNFSDGMIYQLIISPDGTRRFTYLSESVRRLYGISPEDGQRDPMLIYGRVHEDDRETVARTEAEAIQGRHVFRCEVRIHEPSGAERWSSIVSTPTALPDGSLRWDGLEFVITARKKAEEELLRHRGHLEELVAQRTAELKHETARVEQYFSVASSLTVVLDLTGNIIRLNPYGGELLGWNPAELVGRNWFRTCLPADKREAVYQYFLNYVADGANLGAASFTTDTYENEIVTRAGQVKMLLFRNAWIRDENDRVVGTLSSAMDITAVRQAQADLMKAKESAEQANRAKSAFLASMSHEIRTPLNAVLGYSQLLDRSATISAEDRKGIQVINRSGEHLLQLINDILEMSRIEAGRTTCHLEDFDLPGLMDNIKSLFLQRILDKGLSIDVSPSGPPPHYIRTDAGKLRQILINLLSNAVKFTSRGTISMVAEVIGGRLTVAVTDSGPGIAPETLETLFQPFVQAEAGQRRGDGAGLGLAISHGFASLLGGSLTVQSTLGSGSTFILDIQVEEAAGAIRQSIRNQIIGVAPGQRPPRLLVAEDRTESRELLIELLQSTGCQVEGVVNGAEAVAACQRNPPDLIWMDIDMPVLDGLGAAAAIRALPGPTPMIVALTAAAFHEDRARILAGGCDDMTSKPFREEELFRIMERLLDIRFIWKQARPLPIAEAGGSDDELRIQVMAVPEPARVAFTEALVVGDIDACTRLLATWTNRDLAHSLSALVEGFAMDRLLGMFKTDHL